MYATTIPVLVHNLKALAALIKKAEAYCEAKKIEPDAILNFRLYPDMFTFARQVMLTTDFAKGIGARLAAQPVPSFPDVEKTFSELEARVEKTIHFLNSLDQASFKGAETRDVTVRVSRTEEKTMSGAEYLNRFALPNFYFHMTTAYNILRHNGLDLGKGDFMGRGV
jgi:uncharacterized protein